jgi:uracil permease
MEEQHLSPIRKGVVGVQFLFVAFGATVLVPLLIGIDPAVALFTAGVGTLLFHLITKGKVPIFLGSSFAFIAPILEATKMYGLAGALGGMVGVAAVYFVMSALVKLQGRKLIEKLFPPVVVGPVIMLIGLSLSGSAVNNASQNWIIAGVSLLTSILILTFGRGLLKLIPVIGGIVAGYLATLIFFPELIDFSKVTSANWFQLPNFVKPEISWAPIIYMIPVAIAPVIEHIGDVYAVSAVVDKDFVKEPGIHRTMLGDGVACLVSGLLGGPPETTYSEVTGAMSITKVTSPVVMRIAAITAIIFSVVGKVSAFLQSIPVAVLGGIMLLLFGTIANVGVENLINSKVNLSQTRNIIIVAVTLTTGIGGAALSWGTFTLSGIGLAAVIGVVLNMLLPKDK